MTGPQLIMAERAVNDPVIDRHRSGDVTACVDVVIAARNRADTIERAVSSALAQNGVRAVIVIDDASTDDTSERAMQCDPQSGRVIVERLPTNLGPSAARNRALQLSTAPWLAILDGDDYFLPGRVEALMAKSDEADFVADDIIHVHEDEVGDAPRNPLLFADRHTPFTLDLEAFVLGNVRRHGVLRTELGFLKPLIRRSFIEEHRLRYDETLRLGEDYAFYARALISGARFLVIPTPGYAAVVRKDSLSARHSRRDLERLRDSDFELLCNTRLSSHERRALKDHFTSVDCRVQWLRVIEAVKSRDLTNFVPAFCRSPQVTLFLFERLRDEFVRRLRGVGANQHKMT